MTETQEVIKAIAIEINNTDTELHMVEELVQPEPNPRALFAIDQARKYLAAAIRELNTAKGLIE